MTENDCKIEEAIAEIREHIDKSIYPPDGTFFRNVVDEDYFLGLEYAIKIIEKHLGLLSKGKGNYGRG